MEGREQSFSSSSFEVVLENVKGQTHKYDETIQDRLKKGVKEKVDSNVDTGLKHFIPLHAVITPQKLTTKVRIVYDASAKTYMNVNIEAQ